jgi:hypothetical protein
VAAVCLASCSRASRTPAAGSRAFHARLVGSAIDRTAVRLGEDPIAVARYGRFFLGIGAAFGLLALGGPGGWFGLLTLAGIGVLAWLTIHNHRSNRKAVQQRSTATPAPEPDPATSQGAA